MLPLRSLLSSQLSIAAVFMEPEEAPDNGIRVDTLGFTGESDYACVIGNPLPLCFESLFCFLY